MAVGVMQSTKKCSTAYRARASVDSPMVPRIAFERLVRALSVVVFDKLARHAIKVPLVDDDEVVQALASQRADEVLCKGVLPRGAWASADLFDTVMSVG